MEMLSEHKVTHYTAKSYVLDNWGMLVSCLSHRPSCLAVRGQSFRLVIISVCTNGISFRLPVGSRLNHLGTICPKGTLAKEFLTRSVKMRGGIQLMKHPDFILASLGFGQCS